MAGSAFETSFRFGAEMVGVRRFGVVVSNLISNASDDADTTFMRRLEGFEVSGAASCGASTASSNWYQWCHLALCARYLAS